MIIVVIWAVFTLLSSAEANKKTECPPEELIPFCTCEREKYYYDCKFLIFGCKTKYRIYLNCTEVVNERNFLNILHNLKDYEVYEVQYHNLNMRFLPRGFLKYHAVTNLILKESVISGMESDNGKEMFGEAAGTIEKFEMHKIEGANSWRWATFSVLRNLVTFGISFSNITQIGPEFNALPKSLKNIGFPGNRISHISDNAISGFHELGSLSFEHNEISEIRRSMFPDPAKDLSMLVLRGNKIANLPEGIFRNMPSLWYLDLTSNYIKWLPFTVFDPIRIKVVLLIRGNNIYCCGAQEWLVETKFQERILGTCSAPLTLSGKEIRNLTREDLRHDIC